MMNNTAALIIDYCRNPPRYPKWSTRRLEEDGITFTLVEYSPLNIRYSTTFKIEIKDDYINVTGKEVDSLSDEVVASWSERVHSYIGFINFLNKVRSEIRKNVECAS